MNEPLTPDQVSDYLELADQAHDDASVEQLALAIRDIAADWHRLREESAALRKQVADQVAGKSYRCGRR